MSKRRASVSDYFNSDKWEYQGNRVRPRHPEYRKLKEWIDWFCWFVKER